MLLNSMTGELEVYLPDLLWNEGIMFLPAAFIVGLFIKEIVLS